ncbi:TadE-like family protein [Hyphomonas neptunium ATCC 15444]|uniref:TadE-like family protein n=1 Tax=Hyphomonas neptunium (strain ATCC 15444) TaxID=228405 RepID=Q0C456_HYPNA|nr:MULTISPECIES: TadE/TadG family type IV pilus assembly protein [Hyphomonas]ABI77323.1 TadE-like family protein [Hyphomonas neptunium ATCC 15444]
MRYRRLKEESGTAALEFAIISPVFLFMIAGLLAYGIYFGAAHTVQQIAANSARAALAGLDMAEREHLARTTAFASAGTNGLILPDSMEVQVAAHEDEPTLIFVTVTYDASSLPIWNLGPPLPLPDKTIRSVSVIRAGGF